MSDEQKNGRMNRIPDPWAKVITRPAGDTSSEAAINLGGPTDRPGVLRTNAAVVLHTNDAQRMIYGYRSGEQHVQGLIQFASAMGRIMAGSRADDPFADLYITKVMHELDGCKEMIAKLKTDLENTLTSIPGMNINIGESVRPVSIPMGFANPFGYLAAYVLRDYDDVVRAARTAIHVGLLPRESAYHMINDLGGRSVRRLLITPFRYVSLGLTRNKLRREPETLAAAETRMGILPTGLLTGEQRPAMAPRLERVDLGEPVGE